MCYRGHILLVCLARDSRGWGAFGEPGYQSALRGLMLWTISPLLPTGALFLPSLSAPNHARQNPIQTLLSVWHKGVGHSSTKKQPPRGYQSVRRVKERIWKTLPDWGIEKWLFIQLRLCLEDATGRIEREAVFHNPPPSSGTWATSVCPKRDCNTRT